MSAIVLQKEETPPPARHLHNNRIVSPVLFHIRSNLRNHVINSLFEKDYRPVSVIIRSEWQDGADKIME